MEFPRCNNAHIEWYVRMPADLPLTDAKGKELIGQCEEEDATLEATDPMTDN